jgi:hypothetical protein
LHETSSLNPFLDLSLGRNDFGQDDLLLLTLKSGVLHLPQLHTTSSLLDLSVHPLLELGGSHILDVDGRVAVNATEKAAVSWKFS